MPENPTADQQALEADLLTGIRALADYALHGTPATLGPVRDPARELARILDAVEPDDLTLARDWWQSVRGAATPERILKLRAPTWAEQYGLGVGYLAGKAASLLVRRAEARQRVRVAQAEAAQALAELADLTS